MPSSRSSGAQSLPFSALGFGICEAELTKTIFLYLYSMKSHAFLCSRQGQAASHLKQLRSVGMVDKSCLMSELCSQLHVRSAVKIFIVICEVSTGVLEEPVYQ